MDCMRVTRVDWKRVDPRRRRAGDEGARPIGRVRARERRAGRRARRRPAGGECARRARPIDARVDASVED